MRTSAPLLSLALLHACASVAAPPPLEEEEEEEEDSDDEVCGDSISHFKELMFVHRALVENARASNADAGPWSFRYQMEQLAPPGTDAADFARAFFGQWEQVTSINGFAVQQRPLGLERLLDAWPTDTAGKLDLARAPFRLLAIVNRLDLRSDDKPAGEGRLIFGFALPNVPTPPQLTIIFEYDLPSTGARGLSAESWAREFHALGSLEFGEDMAARLETLTRRFTDRTSEGAPTLAQVRSSENLFGAPWEFREFMITGNGALEQVVVANTPDSSLDSSAELATWVQENAAMVRTGKFELPDRFEGGASQSFVGRSWELGGGLDEETRKGFAMNTCNGCHSSQETDITDTFYHVTPQRLGGSEDNAGAVSDFVKNVELPAREQAMQALLCPSGAG